MQQRQRNSRCQLRCDNVCYPLDERVPGQIHVRHLGRAFPALPWAQGEWGAAAPVLAGSWLQVNQYGAGRKWHMGLVTGQKLTKKNPIRSSGLVQQPFISLFSALRPQSAGSYLTFLLCSGGRCAWPTICQWIPRARRVPAAATQERRSRKFQARQSWPVQLAKGLSPRGAGLEELPELDLVGDYTYILTSESLTLKI